jgi:ABC-type transport system involved in multi-copper enzyme maturation permease subunit
MFITIFKKELLDQLLSPKFLIVSLLCLVLVPSSLLLNCASYRNAFREYESAQKEAKDSTTVHREPSILSTFGIGLESILLVLFNLIFFAAAYFSFTKYDVR